ncbi:hypothetical protein MLD38_025665 [Melastoma candidum]|uniref:Uncharacterized protein n=1 Tax=Melastoma candidum TaxID=119954 RepID=A0ACB9NX13_9MYRT|nr:hypothetical protein MLD38_025665 [Melastoma candidum]
MTTNPKSGFILTVLEVAVIHTQFIVQAYGLSCLSEPINLNMCAHFVIRGSSNLILRAECSSTLRSIHHGCLCNTLRMAHHLPSMCQIPPLACS